MLYPRIVLKTLANPKTDNIIETVISLDFKVNGVEFKEEHLKAHVDAMILYKVDSVLSLETNKNEGESVMSWEYNHPSRKSGARYFQHKFFNKVSNKIKKLLENSNFEYVEEQVEKDLPEFELIDVEGDHGMYNVHTNKGDVALVQNHFGNWKFFHNGFYEFGARNKPQILQYIKGRLNKDGSIDDFNSHMRMRNSESKRAEIIDNIGNTNIDAESLSKPLQKIQNIENYYENSSTNINAGRDVNNSNITN